MRAGLKPRSYEDKPITVERADAKARLKAAPSFWYTKALLKAAPSFWYNAPCFW